MRKNNQHQKQRRQNNQSQPVPKLSQELHKRLTRSHNVALMLSMELMDRKVGDISKDLWIPHIFSYLSDDISDVTDELISLNLLHR